MDQLTATLELKLISGEELLAMGDIGPCELIDGRIMPMSPTGGEHSYLESFISAELTHFVKPTKLGWVLTGEVGIYTRRNPDRVRGADIAFISKVRSPRRPARGFLTVAPELVVEIMSPDDRWQDVRQKIEEYLAIGVLWVWIVEPDNRAVLIFEAGAEMRPLGETDTLQGHGILAGFELPLTDLFGE